MDFINIAWVVCLNMSTLNTQSSDFVFHCWNPVLILNFVLRNISTALTRILENLKQ